MEFAGFIVICFAVMAVYKLIFKNNGLKNFKDKGVKDKSDKEDQIENEFEYENRKYLLTVNELKFYEVLKLAVPNELCIVPKVRMADIISAKKTEKKGSYQRAFNKISRKHIDFLICKISNMEMICGFELDDKSHEKKERIERDKFVNNAYKNAGFKLHRIISKNGYSVGELKQLIGDIDEIDRMAR